MKIFLGPYWDRSSREKPTKKSPICVKNRPFQPDYRINKHSSSLVQFVKYSNNETTNTHMKLLDFLTIFIPNLKPNQLKNWTNYAQRTCSGISTNGLLYSVRYSSHRITISWMLLLHRLSRGKFAWNLKKGTKLPFNFDNCFFVRSVKWTW